MKDWVAWFLYAMGLVVVALHLAVYLTLWYSARPLLQYVFYGEILGVALALVIIEVLFQLTKGGEQ